MIMIRREKRQRGSEESLSFVERFDNDEEDENAVDIEKGLELEQKSCCEGSFLLQ